MYNIVFFDDNEGVWSIGDVYASINKEGKVTVDFGGMGNDGDQYETETEAEKGL